MKRLGAKKLTLHKETLRRLTRELTEQQFIKILGGSDGGKLWVADDTSRSDGPACGRPETQTPRCREI